MSALEPKYLWLDLETTGLDPSKDHILEIYALRAPFKGPTDRFDPIIEATIRVPEHVVLSDFIRDMHTESRLLEDCEPDREFSMSGNPIYRNITEVEDVLLERTSPHELYHLAGNSVHFDLGFIREHMPRFVKRCSHRCFDVTAIRLFCESTGMRPPAAKKAHRARADVEESIELAMHCERWVRRGA